MPTESDALLEPTRPTGGGNKLTKSLGILGAVLVVIAAVVGLFVWTRSPSFTSRGVSRSSPYKATQFISFTINTLGGSAKHGECDDRDIDPSGTCYLGNSTDLDQDIRARVRLVEEILRRLRDDTFADEPKTDRNSHVLKIFMMPEFFLRGPNGGYTFEQLYGSREDGQDGILLQVADQLEQLISDEAFKDYLFVFGTVIAVKRDDSKQQDEPDANQVLYYNYAPVIKGGTGHAQKYIVTKKYISSADFLSRVKLPNPRDTDLRYYADTSQVDANVREVLKKRGNKLITDNLIELDGIRIGIEICLDHRLGQLWTNLREQYHSELVDVQLITSAGMAIERGPNPVVPKGVVYLSDGGASSAACWRQDDDAFHPNLVCRGHPREPKHFPPSSSSFFPMEYCIDVEHSDWIQGYYSLHKKQGCASTLRKYGIHVMEEFEYYPPSVEIYPTVDLPWV